MATVPGVVIKLSAELPDRIPLAAEFGPGFVHIIVRDGLSQADTVEALQETWQQIREHYGAERIRLVEAS